MIDSALALQPNRPERRRRQRDEQRDAERPARILEALGVVCPTGTIHVRMSKKPGIIAGFYTNDDEGRQRCVADVLKLVGQHDVWVNLNPFNPAACEIAAYNRLGVNIRCVKDKDTLSRRWILVDCDPPRPKDTASTDAEHTAAIRRAYAIRDGLLGEGFPADCFALADSGNGAHVFIRVELRNTDDDGALVARFLRALHLRWGDDVVEIDLAVANASRVVKLPGTIATKGDDTDERPHREAELLEAPATFATAPASLIETVAGWAPAEEKKAGSRDSGEWPDVEQWCAQHGVGIRSSGDLDGGRKHILGVCPFDPSHDNGAALLIQWPSRVITFRCLHNSCTGKDWVALRDLREPGWREAWKAAQLAKVAATATKLKPIDVERIADTDDVVEVAPTKRTGLEAPEFPDLAMPGAWGELVRLWAPWTEAHPAAIVLTGLTICGIAHGQGVRLGQQRAVLYLAIVGDSSVGRKDTGVNIAVDFLGTMNGGSVIVHGQPNSGEGIWWRMRDPDGEKDAGAADKRLCLIDTEMSGTLAAGHRSGSTVLPAMNALFDTGTKSALTKKDRVSVTNGHFGYIGLTVPSQFARHVTHEDRESGFVQRLLIAAVRKVRDVPPSRALAPLVDQLALQELSERVSARAYDMTSGSTRAWSLSSAASEYFDGIASSLVDPTRPETSRAPTLLMRLAMVYALTVAPDETDPTGDGIVGLSHLRAAVAAWGYCSESASRVFVSDPLVDKVVMLARDAPTGLTRTEVFRHLHNNLSATELDEAIDHGVRRGLLRIVEIRTGGRGRPSQLIRAVG